MCWVHSGVCWIHTDVRDRPNPDSARRWKLREAAHLRLGIGGELVGEDDVGGEDELDALGLGLRLQLLSQLDLNTTGNSI